jgi:hypothetical protein
VGIPLILLPSYCPIAGSVLGTWYLVFGWLSIKSVGFQLIAGVIGPGTERASQWVDRNVENHSSSGRTVNAIATCG